MPALHLRGLSFRARSGTNRTWRAPEVTPAPGPRHVDLKLSLDLSARDQLRVSHAFTSHAAELGDRHRHCFF